MENVLKGPNFVNPDKEDYRIRPSLLLMNQGNNTKYIDKTNLKKGANDTETFAAEKDLAKTSRLYR